VNLIQTSGGRLVFHLEKREKQLLIEVLKLYPRIPPAHQPLSKSRCVPDPDASQTLLDEALAEQRQENKKQLEALLAAPYRFRETQAGCHLSLSASELEWILQILNDIRVGSWVRLGSPEKKIKELNERTAPDIWAMELAGSFQMQLLEAVNPKP
jgi:hypothetical protein